MAGDAHDGVRCGVTCVHNEEYEQPPAVGEQAKFVTCITMLMMGRQCWRSSLPPLPEEEGQKGYIYAQRKQTEVESMEQRAYSNQCCTLDTVRLAFPEILGSFFRTASSTAD